MPRSPDIGQEAANPQNNLNLNGQVEGELMNRELEDRFSDIKTHLYCHIIFILVIRLA